MHRWLAIIVIGLVATAIFACGGDGGGSSGDLTVADAQALLESALITPDDLSSGWSVQTDEIQDNDEAVAADPDAAALNERCGRLLGRTVVNQPDDLISAFFSGETLSFFSTATVYGTEDGAVECADQAAQDFAQPGELARTFGSVFTDPDAVAVQLVDAPQVGDNSFAATLTGQTDAAGTTVDLTILLVGWRQGNVTAAVGSARSGQTPPLDELQPLVDLLSQRLEDGA